MRSALPSAVSRVECQQRHRLFHLLDFRPSKIERNARKIALFYLVRNTPETGRSMVCGCLLHLGGKLATQGDTVAHSGDNLALLHPHHRGFVLILVGGFILGFFGWDDLLACKGFFEFFFSVV